MAKRQKPIYNEDMEMQSLKSEMVTMNKRMEEVITILGGNSSYGVKGMRAEVKELREEVQKLKDVESKRWSIPIKTVPQKVIAIISGLALLLTIFQNIKQLIA